ncbi:serine hydrolase [Phenylobacterium sp.]|uniref:serine hydrolase domain-containing protein n=1 Tax=Phenylobacterium sp. TaxID=1871053 RepID=UPI002736BC4B|nr:serine hydrolase domain-containing protein [Phenylobacterium sp.]MDP3852135.1 serine hydrolase domain-containing protein [Phenylobacterium sp.]
MTRRGHLLATAFALATLSLSVAPSAYAQARSAALSPAVSPESVGFDSQRLKKLDAAMAQAVASGRVVGMQTLLARHGKVVAANTYGKMSLATGQPMQKDAIFRIYSMSKPITGVGMMILFEEGKWRLDDPVSKFLPELKDLKVWKGLDAQGKPILEPVRRAPTMRELMSHTAGFGYGLSDRHPVDKMYQDQRVLGSNGLPEMTTKVSGLPLLFQPGERWSYSVAVDLQGAIIEKLSGQPLGAFLDSRIFKPLKMNDTAFMTPADKVSRLAAVYGEDPKTKQIVEAVVGPTNAQVQDFTKPPLMESGGGGLVGTTADYARFAQMVLNGGELDAVRILSPASVEMMGTNQIPAAALVTSNGSAASFFNESVGFGLDFLVVNDPRKAGSLEGKGTMSWGGAAGTWFWIDPTNDVIFVGMIQHYGGTGDLGGLSRTLVYQALVDPAK